MITPVVRAHASLVRRVATAVLAAATCGAAIAATGPDVVATFSTSTGGGSGTLGTVQGASTKSCFDRATVQSGTTTSTASGTVTVTIASVDPATSFLVFTTSHASNRPVGSEVSGRLGDRTTLEFTRATDEASPTAIDIHWDVVTYACGVKVRRGAVAQNAATVDVAITPVASTAAAFVLFSKVPVQTDAAWGDNDPTIADLVSTSVVQFRVDAINAAAVHTVEWQVVEFTDATKVAVQRGTTTMASTSTTVKIGTVDPTKTFVLASSRSTGTGTDIGSGMVRASLAGPNVLALDRGAANYGVTEVAWQVIELRDGSTVQSGTATMAAGVSDVSPTIATVAPTRSSALLSTQTGGGQNGGSTGYTADDVIGVASFTATLTTTTGGGPELALTARDGAGLTIATIAVTLTLHRNSTVGAADCTWFVVSWGRP